MDRWHCLPYLDGPKNGKTALFGFWPAEQIPAELPDGYRLTPKGTGYTLAPQSGGYAYAPVTHDHDAGSTGTPEGDKRVRG
jgi:hypothetical protein